MWLILRKKKLASTTQLPPVCSSDSSYPAVSFSEACARLEAATLEPLPPVSQKVELGSVQLIALEKAASSLKKQNR